uniref:MaoC-like domain-containing protein n=1 Tax=Lotharella globosa TaxID=91324 RepID=A0A7S4DNL5_9EUKA
MAESKGNTVVPVGYNKRDLILYALGIGVTDLRFLYENHPNFAAFPLYPVVLGFKGESEDVVGFPSPPMIAASANAGITPKGPALDGERHVIIHKPLPPGGCKLDLECRCVGVHPKRSGTLLESEMFLMDKTHKTHYATITTGTFYVGVKDVQKFGKSHSKSVKVPNRAPDRVVQQKTSALQATMYRLSGDYNPLHVDPGTAKEMEFKEPILHGLCTMGHSTNHVLGTYGNNDPAKIKSVRVRFSSPVFPGETLETRMWKLPGGAGEVRVVFETRVVERNKVNHHSPFLTLNA